MLERKQYEVHREEWLTLITFNLKLKDEKEIQIIGTHKETNPN